MRAIVFVGPTLRPEEVVAVLDAECRPPAAQGDIYRSVRQGPRLIGLIDGYFDGVPSVWHKEILWAIAEGVRVYGSASMGALRAAELAPFGMEGVGRIFEDYRDGVIEDDDEVAVLHAPADLGFRPLSEPMVSVRATVERARGEGVLDETAAAAVLARAKAMHYRERTWERLLSAPEDAATERLREWLPAGRVDAKREDALAMLRAMAAALADDAPPPRAEYAFERTHLWHDLTARVVAEEAATRTAERQVLDELRLDLPRYERFRRRAVLRGLALERARRDEAPPDRSALVDEMARHRTRHGLMRRAELDRWLDENGLDGPAYEALVGEGCEIAAAEPPTEALERHLLAELKWAGEYATLRRRAERKAEALADARPSVDAPGRLNLLLWHFEQRLEQPVPEDLDAHAVSLGLADRQELYRVLEREYLYSTLETDGRAADPAAGRRGRDR